MPRDSFRLYRFAHEEPVTEQRTEKPLKHSEKEEDEKGGNFLQRILQSPAKRLVAGVLAASMGVFSPFTERRYQGGSEEKEKNEPGYVVPDRVEHIPEQIIPRYAEPVTVEGAMQLPRDWAPHYGSRGDIHIDGMDVFPDQFHHSLDAAISTLRSNISAEYEVPLAEADQYLGAVHVVVEANASVEGDAGKNMSLSERVAASAVQAIERGELETLGMPVVIEAHGVGEKTMLFDAEGSLERSIDEQQTLQELSARLIIASSEHDVSTERGRAQFERAGNRRTLAPADQAIFDHYYTNARGIHFSITAEPIPMTIELPPTVIPAHDVVREGTFAKGTVTPGKDSSYDTNKKEYARVWEDEDEDEVKKKSASGKKSADRVSMAAPITPLVNRQVLQRTETVVPLQETKTFFERWWPFNKNKAPIETKPSVSVVSKEPSGAWTRTVAQLPVDAPQRIVPVPLRARAERSVLETPVVSQKKEISAISEKPSIFTPEVVGFISQLSEKDAPFTRISESVTADPYYADRVTATRKSVLVDDIYRFIDDAETKQRGVDYTAFVAEIRSLDGAKNLTDEQKKSGIAHVLLTRWKEHDILRDKVQQTESLAALDYHRNPQQVFWAHAHAEELLRLARTYKGEVNKNVLSQDPLYKAYGVEEQKSATQKKPVGTVKVERAPSSGPSSYEKYHELFTKREALKEKISGLVFEPALSKHDWTSGDSSGLRPVNIEQIKKKLGKSKGFLESASSYADRQELLEELEAYDTAVIKYEIA